MLRHTFSEGCISRCESESMWKFFHFERRRYHELERPSATSRGHESRTGARRGTPPPRGRAGQAVGAVRVSRSITHVPVIAPGTPNVRSRSCGLSERHPPVLQQSRRPRAIVGDIGLKRDICKCHRASIEVEDAAAAAEECAVVSDGTVLDSERAAIVDAAAEGRCSVCNIASDGTVPDGERALIPDAAAE